MLGGTVLDRVSSINDLGVIMDEKITFVFMVMYVQRIVDTCCSIFLVGNRLETSVLSSFVTQNQTNFLTKYENRSISPKNAIIMQNFI
jgi:hypothetical protein